MKNLSQIIRSKRKKKKLTIEQFIKKLGLDISQPYITKIEIYDQVPSLEVLKRISKVLDIDFGYIMMLARKSKLTQFEKTFDREFKN